MKIYQLCQKVKGVVVVIREASHPNLMQGVWGKKKKHFVRVKLSPYYSLQKGRRRKQD